MDILFNNSVRLNCVARRWFPLDWWIFQWMWTIRQSVTVASHHLAIIFLCFLPISLSPHSLLLSHISNKRFFLETFTFTQHAMPWTMFVSVWKSNATNKYLDCSMSIGIVGGSFFFFSQEKLSSLTHEHKKTALFIALFMVFKIFIQCDWMKQFKHQIDLECLSSTFYF